MMAVDKQKKEMGKKPRVSFNTNALFKFDDDGNKRINLNTVSEAAPLAAALSFLLQLKEYCNQATSLLGLEFKFQWHGHSYEDWLGDFQQQIELIKWRKQKKKLDELNKKLGKLISEDARTSMELEEIEKLLG